MNNASAIVPDPTARFFDNYMKCLIKASIPENQRRWYVKRLEDFINTQNGHKIKALSVLSINNYLEMIGRQKHFSGWQFHQCIDAIRVLYCELLQTPQCQDVDWHYWFDSAKQLEIDHPTTARQLTPEQLIYIKERKGDGAPNQMRKDHHSLQVRFTQEIRHHHLHDPANQKVVKRAVTEAWIKKRGASIPCGTVSPLICWMPISTSVPCRPCRPMPMCLPP